MPLDPISLKRVVELTFVKSRGLNRKNSLGLRVSHSPRCEVHLKDCASNVGGDFNRYLEGTIE